MHRPHVTVLALAVLTACGGGGGSGTPPEKPAIGSQPQSQVVVEGHAASFTVAATGSDLTYQWSRDGADIAGATSASFTLASPTTGDSGAAFRVTVTNAGGSVASDPATLTVNPKLDDASANFVATWASAQQLTQAAQLPTVSLADSTVRQVVHLSVGGSRFRVKLSNEYGNGPVEIRGAHLARTTGDWTAGDPAVSSIVAGTDHALTFGGVGAVTIPAGQAVLSDSIELAEPVPPLMNMSITLALGSVPTGVSGHPGSRTHSFVVAGDHAADATLAGARTTPRWFYVAGVEVVAPATTRVVAVLGDSLTDGKGSTPNLQDRWPDLLARRLAERHAADPANVPEVAVINLGLGGNNFLGGTGSGLGRLNREILQQKGVKWVIVFMGVNDIIFSGGSADGLEAGYQQLVQQAKAADPQIQVYGATITPFAGYANAGNTVQSRAVRTAVNDWIRTYAGANHLDAFLDFSAAVVQAGSDPEALLSTIVSYPDMNNDGNTYNATDYLHFDVDGYKAMVDAVDLSLFQ